LPVAEDDASVMAAPPQSEDGPVIVGVAAAGLAVMTNAADVAEQPPASVTVTLKEPAADTVIDCVVAPVDQRLPVADDEVSVTVPPAQNEDPPVMVGVACAGLAVTTLPAEVRPATVTVYVPATDTEIDCVVAPVDHVLPVAAEDVRVIGTPGQNDAGPVMVGVTPPPLTVCVQDATGLEHAPFAPLTL